MTPANGWQPATGGVHGLDISVPHPARRYDYWLGGKDNFAADRESGNTIAEAFPSIRVAVVENRRFLRRAVTYLAAEAGIRQFLDIGTGIPTANNTHEVAQAIAPDSRIVYVDNDPIVLVHARARLVGRSEGAVAYIDADLREPDSILSHPELGTLDFDQPIALMLVAVLHFLTDADDPVSVIGELVDALPPGSYVVLSHATQDHLSAATRAALNAADAASGVPFRYRSLSEVLGLLCGLELVAPGIVPTCQWRAEGEEEPRPSPEDAAAYAAVARRP